MHSKTESDNQRPVTGLALEVIGREGSVAFIRDGDVVQSTDLPSEVRATASLTPPQTTPNLARPNRHYQRKPVVQISSRLPMGRDRSPVCVLPQPQRKHWLMPGEYPW